MDLTLQNSTIESLTREYQETLDGEILYQLFTHLLPRTRREVYHVIADLHLSKDIAEDMTQDAFLKLREVALHFDAEKPFAIITYWRRALRNQLLSSYYSKRHKVAFPSEPYILEELPTGNMEVMVSVYNSLALKVLGWRSDSDRHIALSILQRRFFPHNGDGVTQPALAMQLGVSQGFLSRWECWMREALKQELQNLFPNTDIINSEG
jgi:RNA polymerase sigma factor (sigma-70 family)